MVRFNVLSVRKHPLLRVIKYFNKQLWLEIVSKYLLTPNHAFKVILKNGEVRVLKPNYYHVSKHELYRYIDRFLYVDITSEELLPEIGTMSMYWEDVNIIEILEVSGARTANGDRLRSLKEQLKTKRKYHNQTLRITASDGRYVYNHRYSDNNNDKFFGVLGKSNTGNIDNEHAANIVMDLADYYDCTFLDTLVMEPVQKFFKQQWMSNANISGGFDNGMGPY